MTHSLRCRRHSGGFSEMLAKLGGIPCHLGQLSGHSGSKLPQRDIQCVALYWGLRDEDLGG